VRKLIRCSACRASRVCFHPLPLHAKTREGSLGVLEAADADLTAAFDHQAAAGLTAARQKLDTLR
jgi:hypothetical protein